MSSTASDPFAVNLGILSETDMEIIGRTKYLVLGMSLGSVIAEMLVRLGAKNIMLVDNSTYSLSDINREAFCTTGSIGKVKVEHVRKKLLEISPSCSVSVVTDKLSLETLDTLLEDWDVLISQADDIAFSVHALMLAEAKHKWSATCMPSGMTSFVEIYPPDLKKIVDPAALFGAPKGMSYKELYYFLRNPLNRCGRRWHITRGKWSVAHFHKWRQLQAPEPQLCPVFWLGASLVVTELLKGLIGKWKTVRAPSLINIRMAENTINVSRYRWRSYIFEHFIYWTFSIKLFDFGHRYRKFTTRRFFRELKTIERQELKGVKKIRYPLIWYFI